MDRSRHVVHPGIVSMLGHAFYHSRYRNPVRPPPLILGVWLVRLQLLGMFVIALGLFGIDVRL